MENVVKAVFARMSNVKKPQRKFMLTVFSVLRFLGSRKGSAGESQRGLEISMISITDLKSNTAYALNSQQTIDEEGRSRVERYADHADKLASTLLSLGIKHLAADAYYSKVK